MAVFDASGHRIGYVEVLSDGHFFLTREPVLPLVKERIVVDASASVVSVDATGVHLRHDRQELLAHGTRPADAKSSRQVSPGEDTASVHRGDEDHRPLDADDLKQQQKTSGGPRTG
jgi:hypothetical protein